MKKKLAAKWHRELSRERVPKNHVRVVPDRRSKMIEREDRRQVRAALRNV
jgi:hypothetical protein